MRQGQLDLGACGRRVGVVARAPVGVQKTFRGDDSDQVLLMASAVSEWVTEGNLAHFVLDLLVEGVGLVGDLRVVPG